MGDSKVAVLLEDLRAQFRTFGEGLDSLNVKVDRLDDNLQVVRDEVNNLKIEVRNLKTENRREHLQMMQMIRELTARFKRRSNASNKLNKNRWLT